jgi:hypothetical protein
MDYTISFQKLRDVFYEHPSIIRFFEFSHADTLNVKQDIQQNDGKQEKTGK